MDHVQNPLRVAADCFHATLEKGGAAATVESDWGVPLAFWRYLAKEGVSNVGGCFNTADSLSALRSPA